MFKDVFFYDYILILIIFELNNELDILQLPNDV